MKTRVLDSWPILEWMNGREPASGSVQSLMLAGENGAVHLFMSAINVGEIYYFLRKTQGIDVSTKWRRTCRLLPITIDVPTMDDVWNAATLKGQFAIAYADAFAAALAQKLKCPLVTGDPELRSVSKLALEWVGPGPS